MSVCDAPAPHPAAMLYQFGAIRLEHLASGGYSLYALGIPVIQMVFFVVNKMFPRLATGVTSMVVDRRLTESTLPLPTQQGRMFTSEL
jgi:hypothetical protein